jgi:hypothetical protein
VATSNGRAPAERQLKRSVKRGDDPRSIHIYLNSPYRYTALPPQLPIDWGEKIWYNGRYSARQQLLLSTPYHSAMWATGLSIAIKKKASLAWSVEGDVKLRYKRAQQWLLGAGAGAGIFGWVPFLTAGLGSYYLTGFQFIEIERAAKGPSSRVINVHHLDPDKCQLTGNPNAPVDYTSDDGQIRPLRWHDVIIISDQLAPDARGRVMPAAERSYQRIITDEALEKYVYEELTGRNPKAVHFIGGGVSSVQIEDVLEGGQAKADQLGYQVYMGHLFVEVMGDTPLQVHTVPFVGLPDKTDVERERERSDLIYAHNLDIDPQDINPGLIGRQGLGSTGNQSVVLANKAKGFKSWEQQITHQLNELALDDKTAFAFSERDLDDEEKRERIRQTAVETEKVEIEAGIVSSDEARNNLVDAGYLPQEYLKLDITGGGHVTDSEKVAEPEEAEEQRGGGEGERGERGEGAEVAGEEEMETAEKAYWAAVQAWEAAQQELGRQ